MVVLGRWIVSGEDGLDGNIFFGQKVEWAKVIRVLGLIVGRLDGLDDRLDLDIYLIMFVRRDQGIVIMILDDNG